MESEFVQEKYSKLLQFQNQSSFIAENVNKYDKRYNYLIKWWLETDANEVAIKRKRYKNWQKDLEFVEKINSLSTVEY